jgi:hypothetical protein
MRAQRRMDNKRWRNTAQPSWRIMLTAREANDFKPDTVRIRC